MNVTHVGLLAALLFGASPACLFAQDPGPAQTAEARASWLAPFVDDSTRGVIIVDFARIEPAAARALITGGVAESLKDFAVSTADAFEAWRDGFVAAGGTSVAVVFSPKDKGGLPMYIVVRAEGAPDVERLRRYVADRNADASSSWLGGGAEVVLASDQVLIATPAQREGLGSAAGAEAMRRALELVPDAPVRAAAFSTDSGRRAFEAAMPRMLGKLGGGDTARVAPSIVGGALAMDHRAAANVALEITCVDEASAATVGAWLADRMAQLPAAIGAGVAATAEGARVRVNVTGERASRMMTGIAAEFVEARSLAGRMVVMSQARAVVMGCMLHAQNAGGEQFPETMNSMVTAGFITDEQLKGRDGAELFEYVKPRGERIKVAAADTLVVYERHRGWPARGVVVGFVDGHVEIVSDQAKFEQLLKAARPAEK